MPNTICHIQRETEPLQLRWPEGSVLHEMVDGHEEMKCRVPPTISVIYMHENIREAMEVEQVLPSCLLQDGSQALFAAS